MTDIDTGNTAAYFGKLAREFVNGTRAHFTRSGLHGESAIIIDRVIAAMAASLAALLVLLPWGKRRNKDHWVGILIATAARLWTRRGE